MAKRILARGLMISVMLGVFGLGFLVGTVNSFPTRKKSPVWERCGQGREVGRPSGFGDTARLLHRGDAEPCQRPAKKPRDAKQCNRRLAGNRRSFWAKEPTAQACIVASRCCSLNASRRKNSIGGVVLCGSHL